MNLTKESVAIVDDEQQVLSALSRLLESKFNVLTYADAEQFLSELSKLKVAAIICDQRMPKLSGIQVLEQARKTLPEVPRILLTGYSDLQAVIDSINLAQIYRYVQKPWEPQDLLLTVQEAVTKYQLLQESKRLEQAKTEFMLLVNHELKTPVTAISGYLELLSGIPGEWKPYLEQIRTNTDRLQTLIEDTLFIIQVDSGKLGAHPKRLTISSKEAYLTEKALKALNKKNLNIAWKIPEGTMVMFDPMLFHQLLKRIIENAALHGAKDTEIVITSAPVRPHVIEIQVCNDGPPISDQFLSKLGRPFEIDHDILNHHQGFGLGLAICHRILTLHGSRLKIYNSNNKVTVTFTIPTP